jgi:hypothetical protein
MMLSGSCSGAENRAQLSRRDAAQQCGTTMRHNNMEQAPVGAPPPLGGLMKEARCGPGVRPAKRSGDGEVRFDAGAGRGVLSGMREVAV